MKINNEVANVLANSTIADNKLFLPKVQLERKLYLLVNKVLEAIGGKWNRKEQAHLFNEAPEDIVDSILLAGEYTDAKKEYQFFETPIKTAKMLVSLAEIRDEETVLEPSAGRGRIAGLIKECHCIELNEDNYNYLVINNFNVVGRNFMEFHARLYDVIIANPPFTKQQDIDHVNHMMNFAIRRVVSVMSASVLFRDNEKTRKFRNRIEKFGGTFKELPDKTFAESGTNVKACVVCVDVN